VNSSSKLLTSSSDFYFFLNNKNLIKKQSTKLKLTIIGTNDGLTRFLSNPSQSISFQETECFLINNQQYLNLTLKNACFFTSSASFSDDPNLLSTFFLNNLLIIVTDSDDK
jgi:hypothetical protein